MCPHRALRGSAALAALLLSTPASYGFENAPPAGQGVHLDVRGGVGGLWTRFGQTAISGTTLPVSLSVGAALTPRLVLSGAFAYAHVFGPSSSSPTLQAVDLYGFGPAAKYYFAESNFFVSGTLLLAKLRVDDDQVYDVQHSDWGLALDLSLGREWWITQHWGLGIAADVQVGQLRARDDGWFLTKGVALLTVATYNQGPVLDGDPDNRSYYVEARVGGGYMWTRFGRESVPGVSLPFGIAAGWFVSRRLVALADFSYTHLPSLSSEPYLELHSAGAYRVGPRAKLYLSSSGLFVSGAMLLSRIDFSAYFSDINKTHWGVVGDVAIGKDWQVSKVVGIGVAASALLGRLSAGQVGTYTNAGVSALAFATFNYPSLPDASTLSAAVGMSPPELHTHDGLYLGARFGLGWLAVTRSDLDRTTSGWSCPLALSAGFALTRSLVLFNDFYAGQVRYPSADNLPLTDVTLRAIGPGARYYLLPSNVYFSGSVSLAQLSYTDSDPSGTSDAHATSKWGVLGRVSLGKEWWVSKHLGLGLGGEVLLGRMGGKYNDSDDVARFSHTVKGLSLLASASFE